MTIGKGENWRFEIGDPTHATRDEWERAWAPYDEPTYRLALAEFEPDDIVLDIGAGDLRFARMVARRVRRVVAIEQHRELLRRAMPSNVQVICGDARTVEFPSDTTVAVLLMRHCLHYALYRSKLIQTACRRLITNARWGMGVEVVNFRAPLVDYAAFEGGWYTCCCGIAGFKPAQDAAKEPVTEARDCPACSNLLQN